MSTTSNKSGIIPATLAFLTIYNPSLSQSDDTIEEQIVYFYSKSQVAKSRSKTSHDQDDSDRELRNEKLRQVGLAQGMVEFAKTFSNDQVVDSIETEKSRIILCELEEGWWLLASINLTRISSISEPKLSADPPQQKAESRIEYSAREVSPPVLLLEQVKQAHQIFLLHHAQTLTELHSRLRRPKFRTILSRFWDNFVWNWDVLLHGNPAIDIFNGLKLAAGGELGIGVGEEEWGSGEREVLEGFVRRTDGLVDLIVSRFGEAAPMAGSGRGSATAEKDSLKNADVWHQGQDPQPSDGVIFSGVGAVSRRFVKYISHWAILLFKHGHDTYGVRENPVAVNRRRRSKTGITSTKTRASYIATGKGQRPMQTDIKKSATEQPREFGIPAPIVGHLVGAPSEQKSPLKDSDRDTMSRKEQAQPATSSAESAFGTETLMKYMTFGLYGSKLGTSSTSTSRHPSDTNNLVEKNNQTKTSTVSNKYLSNTTNSESLFPGYFMVGLQGDLDEENDSEDNILEPDSATDPGEMLDEKTKSNRIMLRTLVVSRAEHEAKQTREDESSVFKTASKIAHDRLRVVVYVKRPFIFTFLFDLQTDSLAIPSFYRSLHHQLGPLQQPLLNSTSPSKVSERLMEASAPKSTATTRSSQPICDLVYDPYNLTVHTTIPNIPEPGSTTNVSGMGKPPWTRVEALSVHSQILNTYSSTRQRPSEFERTCKTNRGWWVVWMRLPHVAASQRMNQLLYREAFLIRKASDYEASTSKETGGSWGRSTGASGWGPAKLAEGIGIDARQYIEGLVSLNR